MVVVRQAALVVGFACALALGCKATPEQAQNDWQTGEQGIQKAEARYPGFKPALEGLLASARKDFDAAKPDPDKMYAVSSRLRPATKMFEPYEAQVDRVAKLMKDKELGDLPASKINPVMDAAKDAVKKADALVKDAKPANMGEAMAKVEDATKALKGAADGLEALKSKPAVKEPAAKDVAAKPATPAAPAAPASAAPAPAAAPAAAAAPKK
jgi:hypothetical protein